MAYNILSDAKAESIKAFGLAWETPEKMREQYKGYGIDLEKASGETHHILPVPAVYLMGTDGKVLFSYVNPDYKKRLEPQILLAAAKALK